VVDADERVAGWERAATGGVSVRRLPVKI
jgi:hypothetical protein